MKSAEHPLLEVAKRVKNEVVDGPVAVVFDLDSTLFCVSSRTEKILRHLASRDDFRTAYPEAARVLENVEVLPSDWGVRTVLEREQVKAGPPLIKRIRDHWRQNFFSNHYLDHDRLYPFANEYVQHLHHLGAEILYLTGRSQTSMRSGTLKVLKKWQFPLVQDQHLIMKPSDVETDESFKALVLKELSPRYRHLWLFENEPVIIDQVRQHAPTVNIVFVQTVHSGRGQAPQDLPTIQGDYRAGLSHLERVKT